MEQCQFMREARSSSQTLRGRQTIREATTLWARLLKSASGKRRKFLSKKLILGTQNRDVEDEVEKQKANCRSRRTKCDHYACGATESGAQAVALCRLKREKRR